MKSSTTGANDKDGQVEHNEARFDAIAQFPHSAVDGQHAEGLRGEKARHENGP